MAEAGSGAASPGNHISDLKFFDTENTGFGAVLQNIVDRWGEYLYYTVPLRGRRPRAQEFPPVDPYKKSKH